VLIQASLAILGCLIGSAAALSGSKSNLALDRSAVSHGREVFLKYCSFCHETPAGPPLGVPSALQPEAVMAIVANPPANMPRLPLTERDRQLLFEYLKTVPLEGLIAPSDRP
jgi:mono/diheme cytochrome c family protein